jgi:hypothetical protein
MKVIYQFMGFLLMGILSLPLMADTQFQARRMMRQDVPLGMGQCDIRVMIDDEAEVSVRGDTVQIRTLRGKEGRDAGSECNAPLPSRVSGFNFQVIDRRGDIALLAQPSPRTGSSAIVQIRDSQGGEGRYHFRLTWNDPGYNSQGGYDPYDRGGFPRNYPPGGGYGRGGRWGAQGLRFTTDDAINLCSDAVRNNLSSGYRYDYNNVDILNVRPSNRAGWTGWISGDAAVRRGFFGRQFFFNCQVDYSNGAILSLDVEPR